jgi:hypothetical protein
LKRNPREVEEMGHNGQIFAQLHDWTIVASQTEQVYKDVFSATAYRRKEEIYASRTVKCLRYPL